MAEENEAVTDMTEVAQAAPDGGRMRSFKSVCVRLGLMMIVIFVSRGVSSVLLSLLTPTLSGLGSAEAYAVQSAFSLVFLYLIPMTAAVLLLKEPKKGTCPRIYSKPKYFGRALGMFPAFYGLAITTNLLTMLIGMLFSKIDLNKSFNTVNELRADDMTSALILLFQLVVIAPLFEEFWFRGVVMESLRPYGNGFAIFVSALLFGITHANFQQFFYATVIGICLGYIAISTQSIITTTVMHAMFNSISGILLLLMAVPSVGDFLIASQRGMTAEKTHAVIVYLVFLFFVILLMTVGIIMAVFKLRKIKKYRVPEVWEEVPARRRWRIFFSRASVIVMLLLAADTFTFRFITNSVYNLIKNLIN